jgi:hypothetical protein
MELLYKDRESLMGSQTHKKDEGGLFSVTTHMDHKIKTSLVNNRFSN